MTDYTISSKLSNETVYAYYRGRFWHWNGSIWKERRIMTHRFELARAADKKLTPQEFLTNGAEFAPLDEYEIDIAMLDALENAKPCRNAPIEPVEEEPGCQTSTPAASPTKNSSAPAASAGGSSVSTAGAMQDKPLTFIREDKCPAFDYSGLTDQTVEDLHFAEDEYRHGKQMAERGLVHMGNAIAAAHDALCGVVQLLDNGEDGACRTMRKARNNQHSEDTFKSWCLSIGITKDSAYRLLQVSALREAFPSTFGALFDESEVSVHVDAESTAREVAEDLPVLDPFAGSHRHRKTAGTLIPAPDAPSAEENADDPFGGDDA